MAVSMGTIADYNDYIGIIGPIRGMDPEDGERQLYHGTDISVLISLENDPETDTPVGTLIYSPNEIGETAKYPFGFDGSEIASSMADVDDGTEVFRIVRNAAGNIRIYLPITYRKTRLSRL